MISLYTSSIPVSILTMNQTNMVFDTILSSLSLKSKNSDVLSMALEQMVKISNTNHILFDNESINLYSQTSTMIIEKSKNYLNNDNIIDNLFNFIDNLIINCNFYSSSQSSNNNISQNIIKLTNDLTENYVKYLVSGSSKIIERESFRIDIAKLSNVNMNDF